MLYGLRVAPRRIIRAAWCPSFVLEFKNRFKNRFGFGNAGLSSVDFQLIICTSLILWI